jgi:N-acetylmuramoyl-L-alanine amidase
MSILQKIKSVPLPDNQYVKEETNKTQIYLHHTAGSSNPMAVVEYWARNPEKIATSFVIGGKPTVANSPWKDGDLYQAFSSKFWGHHLGLKNANMPDGSKSSMELQKGSIGIEVCNYGPLTKQADGTFLNYVKGRMKPEEVLDLGYVWRGYQYWHNYTDAQLNTLQELLVFLCDRWHIPTQYNGSGMWDVTPRALAGEPGIWSHVSVRKDKTDMYPHPKLIEMLKSL